MFVDDEELIYKRCEEILKNDETYTKLNVEILELERQLKHDLGSKKRHVYDQLEEKILLSLVHSQACIYKSCLIHSIQFTRSNTPLTPH